MKKIVLSLMFIAIMPCSVLAGKYDFQGVGVSIKNKTFDYLIENVRASNYVSNTYYHYSGGNYKKFYFNIIMASQSKPFTLLDGNKCYVNRYSLKSCVPDGWLDVTGYSIKRKISSIFYPYINVGESFGNTYHLYYSYFNDNQLETSISPYKDDLQYMNITHFLYRYKNGWQMFHGITKPNGKVALSFLNIGREHQNIKFDIYNEDGNKVSSAIVVLTHDSDPTYFFTKPTPGLKMELGVTNVGKYGQFIYNLVEV